MTTTRPLAACALLRLACAALCLLAACSRDAAPPSADPLAQTDGRWLVINYWAEWCKPCIEEIPQLQAFAAQHRDRARVLMVNFDGATGDALRQQAARLGLTLPMLEADPSLELGVERPQVLPTTLVVAPDGRVRATLLGPQTVATLAAATEG